MDVQNESRGGVGDFDSEDRRDHLPATSDSAELVVNMMHITSE